MSTRTAFAREKGEEQGRTVIVHDSRHHSRNVDCPPVFLSERHDAQREEGGVLIDDALNPFFRTESTLTLRLELPTENESATNDAK